MTTTPPVLLATFADLLARLQADNVPHQVVDADRQVVAVPANLGGTPTQTVFRWEKQTSLFQIIVPLPFPVPPERVAAFESAVVRVNNAIALPGFGFDHEKGLPYYRLSVPRETDGALRLELLQRLLTSAVANARDFLGALRGITAGGSPEDVIKTALAEKQGPPSTP
jgi:hypothetical protein